MQLAGCLDVSLATGLYSVLSRHARAMGANAEKVSGIGDFEAALARAKKSDRTSVIVIDTDAYTWVPGDAFWEVGVPEVSSRESVKKAKAELVAGKKKQRAGV